ncbi:hypothetical protein FKP32DRAFT_1600982 [Trametes sanguinea]|nr:hypothetical protein FKP32DRAFT_1600982 [Trametes sanguinea]
MLMVTHPHPEDKLYSHLPHTLYTLALRCWPRYYKLHSELRQIFSAAGVQWSSPLLASSEMLSIMQRIHAPLLTSLDLEFRADSSDRRLFHHIGVALPSLILLRIHRYRMPGEDEPPLVEIARALSPLQDLEVLMLHLDFVDLPPVQAEVPERLWQGEFTYPDRRQQYRDSNRTLAHAANVMASLLGPSLVCIHFLRPRRGDVPQWEPFHLVRSSNADGEDSVTAVHFPAHRVYLDGHSDLPYMEYIYEDD